MEHNEQTFSFKTNINCGGCIKAVTPQMSAVNEIKEWKVDTDHADKILTVVSEDAIADKIIAAVKKAGFEISPI